MSRPTAFGPTANPKAYVPYAGAERALEALRHWAFESRQAALVLAAAPGMGKTLLLKLFAARTGGRFRAVYVPNPDCDPDGLCRWVLEVLGRPGQGEPRAALARAARELGAEGGGLILLIDDAELLPPPSASWLFEFARTGRGCARIVLAVADDARGVAFAAALGTDAERVALDTPMSRAELDGYVRSELARTQARRALRAHFDAAALAALHVRTGGVPALLQREAAAIVSRVELGHAARSSTWAVSRRPALWLTLGFFTGFVAIYALDAARFTGRLAHPPASVSAAPPPIARRSELAPVPAPAVLPPPIARDVAAPVEVLARASAPLRIVASVNADPWAEIEIDGKRVGETPIAEIPLSQGRHRFAARMPDGRVLERDVDIQQRSHRIVFP